MKNYCKIVMYHYVRPIKNSQYPKIKGLELDSFKKQITYFNNNFRFIGANDLLYSIYDNKEIPDNSILLTFDDGLKDHYSYVFPILKKMNIQGLFFPSFRTLEENCVLDVHKIHFVLACCDKIKNLLDDIFNFIKKYKHQYNLEAPEYYYAKLASSNRFDSKEAIFIKRILQMELPKELRCKITDYFFKKYVTNDEETFSNNLYLSQDEIQEMIEGGMYFGNHTFSHEWLGFLDTQALDFELDRSSKYYSQINPNRETWIMNYPYGNYCDNVIEKIKLHGYKIGLTTDIGDAILDKLNCFFLKRYDTNDFPQ